jgi:hypothetical protein
MLGFVRTKRRPFSGSDGELRTCSRTRNRNGRYKKAGIGRLEMDRQAGCNPFMGLGSILSRAMWTCFGYLRAFTVGTVALSTIIFGFLHPVRVIGKTAGFQRLSPTTDTTWCWALLADTMRVL